MKVYRDMPLRYFDFWSGAKLNASELTITQLDMLEDYLDELYPEGIDETKLNDFFWFDFDIIKEILGIEEEGQ